MTPCERIDSILKERGMSRRKLAIQAGVPMSTLQCALARNGNLSLDLLLPISDELGVSVQYLSGADELPQMTPEELQEQWDMMPTDEKIRILLDGLNEKGKKKVLERLEELAELPKYQKGE